MAGLKISELSPLSSLSGGEFVPVYDPNGSTAGLRNRMASIRLMRGAVFNADDYLLGDGTAEDTAWATMIAAVVAAGGGTIQFGAKTYRLDNAWIPTYSGTPPRQKPIVIQGAATDQTGGTGLSPVGGTIFDLQYDAAGEVAKWDTRGVGSLCIYDCTFKSGGSATNGTPFIKTTNTHLHISNCFFLGNNAGVSANQDAIVLGGSTTSFGGSGATQAFQGYGTVIEGNYFSQIRRCVYGRIYCNGVVVQNNIAWTTCGGTAAFEWYGDTSDGCAGNYFCGNLVEVTNYNYAFKMTNAYWNTFSGNNIYDPSGTTLAYYRFDTQGYYNTVIAGSGSDVYPLLSEDSTVTGKNTVINGHAGGTTNFANPVRFITNDTLQPKWYGRDSTTSVYGPQYENANGDLFDTRTDYVSGTGFGHWYLRFKASGGSIETLLDVFRASATQLYLDFIRSGGVTIQNVAGDIRLLCKNGGTAFLGDLSDTSSKCIAVDAGGLRLPTMPDSQATNNRMFIGSDHSNKVCFKDGSGVVNVLY